MENKFCSNCGAKLEIGSKFCTACGTKVGEIQEEGNCVNPQSNMENTIVKSKRECIYDAVCNYMRRSIVSVNGGHTFGELENYEDGENGSVYCELVCSVKNLFGQTKKTRYGAVIDMVEADGNVVFRTPGPQLITPISGTRFAKLAFRFKKLK